MADGSGRYLLLDDRAAGYVTVELDTGYGAPREVTSNRPDAPGVDDETALPGSRAVSLTVSAWGERLTLDEIIHLFTPYLSPSKRPVLRWSEASTVSPPPERTLTLRAASFASPMTTPDARTATFGWVAPDPAAYDSTVKQVQAWASGATGGGRTYSLTYPRTYPPLVMGGASAGMTTAGEYDVQPSVILYGPGDHAAVTIAPTAGTGPSGVSTYLSVALNTSLDVGDFVRVDFAADTAVYYDASTGVSSDAMGMIDWGRSLWRAIPAGVPATVTYSAGNATATTQAVVTWQDGYQ